MKQLFEDVLNVSASVKELMLAPTPRGHLQYLIRLERPNWSASECFRAGHWMKRNGLQPRAHFPDAEQFHGHLNQLLMAYDKAFPVRGQLEVADELALSRWEARWQRNRSRQQQRDTKDSLRAASMSSAA